MKLSIMSSLTLATAGVIAATTIPLLNTIDIWGFVNLDIDGVLRSWSSNGTVLDAAALSPSQITEFINMREGIVEAQRTADEKVIFAHINGLDVPNAQLFNPPEDVIPVIEIADAEASRLAHDGILPAGPEDNTIAARSCVPAYCNGPNYECVIYVVKLAMPVFAGV